MGISSEELKSSVISVIQEQLKTLITNENFKAEIEKLKRLVEEHEEKGLSEKMVRNLGGKNANPFSAENYIQYEIKSKEKEAKAYEIYEKCNDIIDTYIRTSADNLDYAIYFQDTDGTIYRMKMSTLTNLTRESSVSKNRLQVSKEAIRNAVKEELEKDQGDLKNLLNITEHYSNMLQTLNDCYLGASPLPNKKINQGHLIETFERHLQNEHSDSLSSGVLNKEEAGGWALDKLWFLVRLSRGNAPWYSGGDVGSTQVKFLTEIRGGNLRLSSQNSLVTVVNILINTLTIDLSDENSLKKTAELYYKKFWQDSEETFSNGLDDQAKQSLKKYFKDLGFNLNEI